MSFSHLAFAQSPVASQEFTVGDYAEVEVSTSGGRIEVIGKSTTKVTVNAIAYVNGRRSSNANLDNWSITIEEIQGKIVAKAEKESNMGWLRCCKDEHFPPLVAAMRAGATGDGAAAAGAHVRSGADGCAVA